MLPSLSRRVEAFWYGSSPLAVLLQPLSWLFQAAVWLRRLAYRVGLRQQVRLPVPVVIIGNLSVGGTGKTPIVIWLADWLRRAGYRPGIVSRGYGGRRQENGVLVTAASDPEEVGDEPIVIARRTGCPVCVARDRSRAAQMLIDQGVDIVLADEDEINQLVQTDSFDATLEAIKSYDNLFAITRSHQGSVIVHGDQHVVQPATPVESVVDSTGAGDAYSAGFMFGWANNYSLAECARLGTYCATTVIRKLGARIEPGLMDNYS